MSQITSPMKMSQITSKRNAIRHIFGILLACAFSIYVGKRKGRQEIGFIENAMRCVCVCVCVFFVHLAFAFGGQLHYYCIALNAASDK